MRSPIVLSIATLRAVSDIPILVLDVSPEHRDWYYFPEKLGFQVKQTTPSLSRFKDDIPYNGWMNLSRHHDMRREAKEWS